MLYLRAWMSLIFCLTIRKPWIWIPLLIIISTLGVGPCLLARKMWFGWCIAIWGKLALLCTVCYKTRFRTRMIRMGRTPMEIIEQFRTLIIERYIFLTRRRRVSLSRKANRWNLRSWLVIMRRSRPRRTSIGSIKIWDLPQCPAL